VFGSLACDPTNNLFIGRAVNLAIPKVICLRATGRHPSAPLQTQAAIDKVKCCRMD
jgi:hypothetical protein